MSQQTAIEPGNNSAKDAEQSVACPADAHALNDLSRQLRSWSHLWAGVRDDDGHSAAHRTVGRRISAWLDCCFGIHAGSILIRHSGDVSLATSTPLFAAFLGRRAARELSRDILKDT